MREKEELFQQIRGKTIAIVYIFEGEDAKGFGHYHVWKSDIIAPWLLAVQQLCCMPLILDVRTFVEKAICNTLPQIDFVLNLNCGSIELSPMALVPSVCSFINVPCIPCDAFSIVTGENKKTSNILAAKSGFCVPKSLDKSDSSGIYKPLNLGSSLGVHRKFLNESDKKGLYQEFIPGYDLTIPMVYNPLNDRMDFLPTILYVPDNNDINWFLDENYSDPNNSFRRCLIHSLSARLKENCRNLAEEMNINTFCRIDARFKKASPNPRMSDSSILQLQAEDVFFLEINPMPTISTENAFFYSYHALTKKDEMYHCAIQFCHELCTDTLHSFILGCSMMSHYNQMQK